MPGQLQQEWSRESEQQSLARLQREHLLVLVYTRQSKTDFDADGSPRGPSLDAQLEAFEHIPQFAGCPLEHFQDADRSGRETSRRPGYLQMLNRLRTAPPGSVGAVFFYDQDRLHRNVVRFYEFMQECEMLGILVFDGGGLVRNEDELAWGIKAVVASVERKKLARRVRDALRYRKAQGKLLGHAPVGYQRDPVTGALNLDPNGASIIRKVFELYASGLYSFRTLARHLNETAVSVPRNADYPKENVRWSLDLLKGLLSNTSYLGKVKVGVDLVAGTHPQLIDETTFGRCQAVRISNRRRRTHYRHHRNAYPLQSILMCGRCGGRLQGHRRPELGRHWYRCANRRGGGCDLPWLLGEVLEEAVGFDLRRYVTSVSEKSLLAGPVATSQDRPDVKINALVRRKERIKVMFELGDLDRDDYVEKMRLVNLELQRVRTAAIETADADVRWAAKRIAKAVDIWMEADPIQRGIMAAETVSYTHLTLPTILRV